MAMGSKGTVNMTVQMFENIITAVDEYRTKTNQLKKTLDGLITALVGTDFVGAAANGYKAFYASNIQPANGEGLTKLMDAIDQIAAAGRDAIPGDNGLDDQLGQGNTGGSGS